jgi:hypothetical protein
MSLSYGTRALRNLSADAPNTRHDGLNRLPYGANGWQLCMAAYGTVYALRHLWPHALGHGLVQMLMSPAVDTLIGALVLTHSAISAIAVLFGRQDYWQAMLASLGAVLWTSLGITSVTLEWSLAQVPSWGIFQLVGGIGLSVAMLQRARDPTGRLP